MNRPSGFKAPRICASAPGRSFAHCSASSDTTRSRLPRLERQRLGVADDIRTAFGEAVDADHAPDLT